MTCSVESIRWERVLLHLEVRCSGAAKAPVLFLQDTGGRRRFRMRREPADGRHADGVYGYYINITNPGTCSCIPDGEYRVVSGTGDFAPEEIRADCDTQTAEKRFYYNSRKDCCICSFGNSPFRFRVRTQSHSAARKLRKTVLGAALTVVYRIDAAFAGLNGTRRGKKSVLFLSGQSQSPGANLTAVRDRMRARGLAGDRGSFRILESYRDRNCGWVDLLRAVHRIAMADYIFLDDHEPLFDYFRLNKDTVLTQLWHAGVGFKSSGYSRFGLPGGPEPFMCHRQYTWGIVSSRAVIPIFSEIWGINDAQVLPVGLPRMDRYLDPDYRSRAEKKVRDAFPLIRGKKVILFAPTYRGKGKGDAAYPYEQIDFARLYETLGNDAVVLFCMHPWVKRPVPIPEGMKDRMEDARSVADINDLFYVTDLLITDYSSAICEYSLMDRPMLFYAFDEKDYAKQRGFHRDYQTYAPGKVCHTFDELLEAVKRQDFEQEKAARYVQEQFDRRDSGASDRVIDCVLLGKSAASV